MKRFIALLVASWIVIIIYLTCFLEVESPQKEIDFIEGGDIQKAQTIDSLQKLVDSLYAENYPCQIELNRYQIAYQIFLKRNPTAAKQYGTIISEETE
jgi:hypothetical protein